MKRNRRAKIVATIGPSSSDKDTIRRLFEAGVDVFRLNFSHGSFEDHQARHTFIREIEKEANHPISILQDLQGPKIRLGALPGGKVNLEAGKTIRFVLEKSSSDPSLLPLPHKEVFDSLMPGQRVFIDDGKVRVAVKRLESDYIEAEIITGGIVSDRKGVNLPDTLLSLSPITERTGAILNSV